MEDCTRLPGCMSGNQRHRRPSFNEAQNSVQFTRKSKPQATVSNQKRFEFRTKKNVGLKGVSRRQFVREWNSRHLTRKGTTFSPVTCVGPGTEKHPLPSIA